jgi:hypothetical protein
MRLQCLGEEHPDTQDSRESLERLEQELKMDSGTETNLEVYALVGQKYDHPEEVEQLTRYDPVKVALRRLEDGLDDEQEAFVPFFQKTPLPSYEAPFFLEQGTPIKEHAGQSVSLAPALETAQKPFSFKAPESTTLPNQTFLPKISPNSVESHVHHEQVGDTYVFSYHSNFTLVRSERIEIATDTPDVFIDEKAHAQLLHYAEMGTLLPAARAALDQGGQLVLNRDLLDVHHQRTVTLTAHAVMDEKMEAQARFFAGEGIMFDTLRDAVGNGRAHVMEDFNTEERQEEQGFFDGLGFFPDLWQNPLEHTPLELLKGLAHDLLHIDISSHFHV